MLNGWHNECGTHKLIENEEKMRLNWSVLCVSRPFHKWLCALFAECDGVVCVCVCVYRQKLCAARRNEHVVIIMRQLISIRSTIHFKLYSQPIWNHKINTNLIIWLILLTFKQFINHGWVSVEKGRRGQLVLYSYFRCSALPFTLSLPITRSSFTHTHTHTKYSQFSQ